MGRRLGEEVEKFLFTSLNLDLEDSSWHLSFVGHSVGNLIIRSALCNSAALRAVANSSHLRTFISLCGPHLGAAFSRNRLFNSGLWILRQLRRKSAPCLSQLAFADAARMEHCFLYRLAFENPFVNFRYVVLAAAPEDRYVPYFSARVEENAVEISASRSKCTLLSHMTRFDFITLISNVCLGFLLLVDTSRQFFLFL